MITNHTCISIIFITQGILFSGSSSKYERNICIMHFTISQLTLQCFICHVFCAASHCVYYTDTEGTTSSGIDQTNAHILKAGVL